MSDIKRFEITEDEFGIRESADGDYCFYYELIDIEHQLFASKSENKELQAQNKALTDEVDRLRKELDELDSGTLV